ncbi:Peptidyl-glycine alpha-amidating monooxygenase B [Nymphon striatum]|nr:Peptidyl-glycine alpha-amidating monooxygenase B [Nymphon striatum]
MNGTVHYVEDAWRYHGFDEMKITGSMIALLYILFLITLTVCEDVTISMPGVTTSHKDQYLCTAIKLNNASKYIRKFTVNADASKAHHMILFGCDMVSDDKVYPKFWDCGSARICNGHMSIKYAWAKNAPPTNLPKDVGFEIGSQRSKVQYLILQVHYAILMKPGKFFFREHDHSSIVLNVSPKMPTYLAGIHLLLASEGVIPAHSPVTHIDANCQYRDRNPMYIFAYRTHAHKLGRVITGYRYRQRSRDKWSLIAKGNPQWPQVCLLSMLMCLYSFKERKP